MVLNANPDPHPAPGPNQVPTLVLNAEDDFVCPAALAQPEVIVEQQPGCLLLVARRCVPWLSPVSPLLAPPRRPWLPV